MCSPFDFKNGAEISVYAKEVTDYNTIKVSLTWEIKSGDIANSVITNNNDLLYQLFDKPGMLVSKCEVEISFNYKDEEGDLNKEFIEGVKGFMKNNPDGIRHENYHERVENEEITNGFPIKIDVIWEKNIKDLEDMELYDIVMSYKQFNIEADGKVVNVNELMSMVNEHHGSSLASDANIYYHSPEVEYMSSI